MSYILKKLWEKMDRNKRKEAYRNRYMRAKVMNDYTLPYRERLIRALVKAAKDTQIINLREHISPEKSIRIGNFVTCLRREITAGNAKDDFHYLTDCSNWSDVLMLKLNGSFRLTDELKDIVMSAQARIFDDGEAKIMQSFKELDALSDHADRIIGDARAINKNAEPIIEGLNSVAQDIYDTHNG